MSNLAAGATIAPSENAPNIVRITADSLILTSGTTYRFTVDTPEDGGLVSTGLTVEQLSTQIVRTDGLPLKYKILDARENLKATGEIVAGDMLEMEGTKGRYHIGILRGALAGKLLLHQSQIRANTPCDLTLDFIAGQRSPKAKVELHIPAGIRVTPDNTTVNVIGRGEVTLNELPAQSIGRTGTNYSYKQVGKAVITGTPETGQVITFSELDLRPLNGIDLRIKIKDVQLSKTGSYPFKANYVTAEPEVYASPDVTGTLTVVNAAVYFARKISGAREELANTTGYRSGKINAKELGVKGDGATDDTDSINAAIALIHRLGGGTLFFPQGVYNVRTIYLKSNVWLYIDREATIQAIPGSDEPESTWFSDRAYRSGLSPTDPRPYENPENWLTKQDVGHTFFRNAMFFAERENNIKILGNGRITGNGNLATSDGVMKNEPGKRADKMFSFKLCTNIEIGGLKREQDLWYDPERDEPYYITPGGGRDFDTDNMLQIDRGGHFVLLATGTDTINVHDTYFAKHSTSNARDIYDFMACNHVVVTNIYSKVSSDDIVKLGSDCSLGFTRPVKDYKIRNVIGDTNCNLFQIGSETADDIQDVYVDNIYVLGANKAGFSISTNDGATVKNVHLNSGHTGKIHSRSMMFRTRAPFFISISNRGRVIGADVQRFRFQENEAVRDELLCTNSNIGKVENISIQDIDVYEVYAGSSFRGNRWKAYDGSQSKATPIIAGYKLPDPSEVEGGLGFTLPDGRHTGYITDIRFEGVNLTVKGGHPASDAEATPPELGVGRYNVGDLKTQPAFGFWFRHAKDVQLKNCTIRCETPDARHAIVLDDVIGADIQSITLPANSGAQPAIKEIRSANIRIRD
ncbi:MAG: endopygalactorunase [Tannerella sp.]|nr:endopygalactorunase [Tannerella sp.]